MSNFHTKFFSIKVLRILLVVFFVVFYAQNTHAATFSRNLKIGLYGDDVRQLQILLNSNPNTLVSQFGAGSPGQETGYFGPATRRAVISFQEMYSLETLSPVGLTRGTGFVGPLTINKLNSLQTGSAGLSEPISRAVPGSFSKLPIEEQIDIYKTDSTLGKIREDLISKINIGLANRTNPNIDFSSYKIRENSVFIRDISTQQGPAGTRVQISGNGFLSVGNDVYLGKEYMAKNIASDGNGLNITVPNIKAGRYDLVVTNTGGISNSVVFVVTDEKTRPVSISSISPSSVGYGDKLTIRGSGFSTTSNELFTNFGRFKNIVSSDGVSMEFKFEPDGMGGINKLGKSGKVIPVELYLINENGITDQASRFDFNI